jgi:hypothetical protein
MRKMAAELPLRKISGDRVAASHDQGFCDLRPVFQEHISLKKKEERLE